MFRLMFYAQTSVLCPQVIIRGKSKYNVSTGFCLCTGKPSQTASRGPAQAMDHYLFFLGSESESDMIPVLLFLSFAAGLFYGLTCLLEKICLNLLSIYFLFCPVRSGRMARSMEIDLYARSYAMLHS